MYSKPNFILNDFIKIHYLPEIAWFAVTYFWDHFRIGSWQAIAKLVFNTYQTFYTHLITNFTF